MVCVAILKQSKIMYVSPEPYGSFRIPKFRVVVFITATVWCVPFFGTVGLFNKLQTQKIKQDVPAAMIQAEHAHGALHGRGQPGGRCRQLVELSSSDLAARRTPFANLRRTGSGEC